MKISHENFSIKDQFHGFLSIPSLWNTHVIDGLSIFHLPHYQPGNSAVFNLVFPDNTLLGKRAEQFFSYQLKSSSQYSILLENIQIHQNKITLGELDYILEDSFDNSLYHVELVCKIYLLDDLPDQEIWIGPNRKDSLSMKMEKLRTKQIPLLHHQLTQDLLLKNELIPANINQQLCFKAMLFVHHNQWNINQEYSINERCIVGYWLYNSEFLDDHYGEFEYYIPKKKNWFVEPNESVDWFSFEEMQAHLAKHHASKNSPMCWMKTDQNCFQKFFVVWW